MPRASAAPARSWSPGRASRHRDRVDAVNACLIRRPPPRRPGGGHGRGPRHPPGPAPRAAGDGRPWRLAVRLLHPRASSAAWPRSTTAPVAAATPARAGRAARDHEHGPNGFDLHALSGNLCRCTGYRPIRDAAYALGHPRPGRRPSPPGPRALPRRAAWRPGSPRPAPSSSGPPTWPRPSRCWPSVPDAMVVAGSHRLGRRGQPPRRAPAADSSPSTGCPSCASSRSTGRARRDRRRASASPRSSAGSTGGSRSWPSCSRSSPPG